MIKEFDENIKPHWKGGKCEKNFSFSNITIDIIIKELLHLDETPNLDVLNFDRKLLKLSSHIIAPYLARIFNDSLENGNVHPDFKKARVTPVFKGGKDSDVNLASDYRPISVLPHIAKLFEKLVKLQLIAFMEASKVISSDQSAYLQGHSTIDNFR